MTTGDLRLIRDEALRGDLVSYAARVDGVVVGNRFYAQQAFGDVGRLVRAFPFMRGVFAGDEARVRDEARRFQFARLRGDADAMATLFSIQAANSNRLHQMRELRRATQRLRRALEAQHAGAEPGARHDSALVTPK
ncbi:hypothetical protein tb265_03110 [Gemmatimonadetes bacterium T265]|nr:hypothetical protein tb265_03110 [Gemmatimonadetes bacterium T265]